MAGVITARKRNGATQRCWVWPASPTAPATVSAVVASATAEAAIRSLRIAGFFVFARVGAIGASTEPGPWLAPMRFRRRRPTVASVPCIDVWTRRFDMLNRLLPLSGSVFVALTVVAFAWLGGSTPGGKDPAAKVTAFYTAHHGRESAAAYVLCVAAAFLVLFAASVWRRAEASVWRFVFVAGGAVASAGFLVGATIHLALSEGVHDGIGPSATLALNALDANDYLPFGIGMAVMLLGAAGLAIPRRGVERVLGWSALVLAVASFTPVGFVAFVLSGVWVIATGIVLSLRAAAEMRTGAAPAPAATA